MTVAEVALGARVVSLPERPKGLPYPMMVVVLHAVETCCPALRLSRPRWLPRRVAPPVQRRRAHRFAAEVLAHELGEALPAGGCDDLFCDHESCAIVDALDDRGLLVYEATRG